MSTDKNKFDIKLKKNLFLDIAFRLFMWLSVSFAAAYLSISNSTQSSLEYFERMSPVIMTLVDKLGTFGLLLCVLALFLKDIETVATTEKVRNAMSGNLGGFVRRTAGDISLWTLGALSAVLATFILTLCSTKIQRTEWWGGVSIFWLIMIFFLLTTFANVYVRREGPSPFLRLTKKPVCIFLFWTFFLLFLVWKVAHTPILPVAQPEKTMESIIDIASKILAFVGLLIGTYWGAIKYLRRDEHFPRIGFAVSANFVGYQNDQVLFEVLAELENKGVVPIKINDLKFKVRGLYEDDEIKTGDESIRGQIRIPHLLIEGSWVPKHWNYTFIYPGVKTEYNYVATLPLNVSFVRVEGSFSYDSEGNSHHAAKLQKVPNKIIQPTVDTLCR